MNRFLWKETSKWNPQSPRNHDSTTDGVNTDHVSSTLCSEGIADISIEIQWNTSASLTCKAKGAPHIQYWVGFEEIPQRKTSKMTEVRQSSSQQQQSLRWIKTSVGVILAVLLLFVLFKELHSLSKGLEETRKSLHELTDRLAEEKEKNEKLRRELGRVKERMDNILEVFSNLQKVTFVCEDSSNMKGLTCKPSWI